MKKTAAEKKAGGNAYLNSKLFTLVNLVISLLVVGIVFVLVTFHILEKMELNTVDLRFKFRGAQKTSPDILMVDIDEDSLSHIGWWPWSREWHAGLISTLKENNAKIIAFDIFFSEPNPLVDFFLIEATRMSENVLFALAFEQGIDPTTDQAEAEDEEPSGTAIEDAWTISPSQIYGNKSLIPEMGKMITPLSELYEAAHGVGHVNAIPDIDGAIRKIPSIIKCKNKYYFHFAIEGAIKFLGLDQKKIKVILGKYIDLGMTPLGPIRIPIDKGGFIWVNWAAPWGKDFKHYPYWKVVASYQQKLKNKETLIPLDVFKDKFCLIGLTATGLIDIKPMPLQTSYPIVGLHSNMVNTILQKNFIREAGQPINFTIILILAIIISLVIPRFRPAGGFSFAIILIAFYILVAYAVFRFAGILINVIYPITAVSLNYVAVTIHSEIVNLLERGRLYQLAIQDGLTRLYVVRHFKEILQQEMDRTAKQNLTISVIISDIDHFKHVNDTYGHLVGDFILKQTANVFQSSCREGDVAGRYGGEEFVIMLPETNLQGAVEFAERLRALIEKVTFEYNDLKLNVTISFGVAEFKGEKTPAELIKRADEALYVAKETGRNKVCFN